MRSPCKLTPILWSGVDVNVDIGIDIDLDLDLDR